MPGGRVAQSPWVFPAARPPPARVKLELHTNTKLLNKVNIGHNSPGYCRPEPIRYEDLLTVCGKVAGPMWARLGRFEGEGGRDIRGGGEVKTVSKRLGAPQGLCATGYLAAAPRAGAGAPRAPAATRAGAPRAPAATPRAASCASRPEGGAGGAVLPCYIGYIKT